MRRIRATWNARRNLALDYNNLGALEAHRGQYDLAKAAYRKAIAAQEQLERKAPAVLQFRLDLAVSHNNLGRAYSESGDPAGADASFRQAREILEKLAADYPDDLNYHSSLAGVMNNCGMMLEQLGRLDEAAAAYRQAIQQQLIAYRRAADVTAFRELLSKHYWNYGRTLRAAGRPQEAVQAALARKELWPDNPQRLYTVAVELAMAAEQLTAKQTDGDKQPDAAAEKCAAQAIATLGEAVRLGFVPSGDLESSPDFKGVRRRPEFHRLLDSLAKAEKN